MFRTFLTFALSMFLLVEASAQTTPVATKKTTTKTVKATARTSRRAAKKARRVALQSAPVAPRTNDGWPPLEDSQAAVASTATATATTDNAWGAATAPAANNSRGEIDNANVYAAPGQPVHIRTSNGMVPYSVRPARKLSSGQTTLGN